MKHTIAISYQDKRLISSKVWSFLTGNNSSKGRLGPLQLHFRFWSNVIYASEDVFPLLGVMASLCPHWFRDVLKVRGKLCHLVHGFLRQILLSFRGSSATEMVHVPQDESLQMFHKNKKPLNEARPLVPLGHDSYCYEGTILINVWLLA